MSGDAPLFGDRTQPPADEELASALGPAAGRWRDLAGAAVAMGGRVEWSWGGARHGWSWKTKRAGRPFLALEPDEGCFRALVVLGRDDSVRAAELPLGQRMRATYEAARQYPDGRWLFHSIETDEDVRDVLALLRLKLPPTVRARFEAAAPR